MGLRRFIKKTIDPERVSTHSYEYWSNGGGADASPIITLMVQCNSGTPDEPDYSLMIRLNNGCKIKEILRLRNVWGVGSYIKKFPLDVEIIAEELLTAVITDISLTDEALLQLHDKTYSFLK